MGRYSDQRITQRGSKGMALIIVIGMALLLIIIAGAILLLASGHYHTIGYQIKHTKAFYLAEAGSPLR